MPDLNSQTPRHSALLVDLQDKPAKLPLRRLSKVVRDLSAALPTLLGVLVVTLRKSGPLGIVNPERWPSSVVSRDVDAVRGVVLGLRLCAPLVKLHPAGICVIRSIAIYRLLSRQGTPVQWVCGFSRPAQESSDGNGTVGHAWVEIDGRPLAQFGDASAPDRYVETIRVGRSGRVAAWSG